MPLWTTSLGSRETNHNLPRQTLTKHNQILNTITRHTKELAHKFLEFSGLIYYANKNRETQTVAKTMLRNTLETKTTTNTIMLWMKDTTNTKTQISNNLYYKNSAKTPRLRVTKESRMNLNPRQRRHLTRWYRRGCLWVSPSKCSGW